MDLNQLLSQYLPDETLANLASQAGIQDSHQGVAAAKSVLTTLMQGLSNNTESQNGAGSLINALERNHDGSILDNLSGFLNMGNPQQAAPAFNAAGILGHILGFKQQNVANGISQVFKLDLPTILKLMGILAPVLMGLLGKAKSSNQINPENVQQVLGQTVQKTEQQNSGYGIFGKLLDTNNDGSISDDILKMGMNLLLKR
ncbi:MAG: DUF937 domain-containing protein [Saprospiraceae bacterium]|nr:DUF937 domain-containing protein [Saprospiraceae bacterium]MBK9630038.1 DUF937 domain-containing protein [Saprospiraceae bacterium]